MGLTVLFNSFSFLVFFTTVTAAFFLLPHRFRWALLLAASCVFYMFFVPVYILILALTIVIDYFAALLIERSSDPRRRKSYLTVSIVSVCLVLFVFKYFNFFNDNARAIAAALHWNYGISALRIILPIGLSFHTFQSLSYVIEVYRGRQKAERHFGIYALYVMYFPQLVAGPIERPQNLLHQFHEEKRFDLDRVQSGLSLVLWGLCKKVMVADALAIYVDSVYNSSAHHTGASLLLATYCFAFQIYCDFSGYSDMARGLSRVYGIELMVNFDAPYLARSVGEFWSRWHISLSTWFKDYVYIPLGGNRVSLARHMFNVFAVFMLSGLWHGANWTFVVWGALHGLYLVCGRLWGLIRTRFGIVPPEQGSLLRQVGAGLLTFHLVLLAWVFFRADKMSVAFDIVRRMLVPTGTLFIDPVLAQCVFGVLVVFGADLFLRRSDYWNKLDRYPVAFRFGVALSMLFCVILFGIEKGAQFIYFQF
jgi:D-alanyl-lipoteichoic acid acyltransferase DltB (MBOAT superfamily)